jgi:hypothetical protein
MQMRAEHRIPAPPERGGPGGLTAECVRIAIGLLLLGVAWDGYAAGAGSRDR